MLISVNNFQEAEKYPVMFGNSEMMLDNNRDVFYVKAVDMSGRYVMSTYEFRQIENEKPLTADNFVTREQFNAMNNKLDLLLEQLSQPTGGNVNEQRVPEQSNIPQPQRKSVSRTTNSATTSE